MMDPTHADVPYGPHPRQTLDFYAADPKQQGADPRPLLVYIHGGGWRGGDKAREPEAFAPYLERGISYAAVNYRLTDTAILPAPVHDAARALQYVRSRAAEWNIDAGRVALTGGSAGACTSMWLLYHEDLADPQAADPVARQSTRVTAAAVWGGQTSIDIKVIEPWMGPEVLGHQMTYRSVGAESIEDALENYEAYAGLYREFSPINHLSVGAPPLLMTYDQSMELPAKNPGHGIHHPLFGVKLKERADALGVECHLLAEGSGPGPYATAQDFLLDKLLS